MFLASCADNGSPALLSDRAFLNFRSCVVLLMIIPTAHAEGRLANIIAGSFEEQSTVAAAVGALRAAGFPAEHISSFFVSPAGQHARYTIGGDHDKSTGAQSSAQGTAAGTTTGGVIGAAIGAITTPLTGPIGAITGGLVGAHVGNLVGALGAMKEDEAAPDSPAIRHAGLLVAVSTPTERCKERAIALLREHGAITLESSDGHIVNGDWQDFDPSVPPHLIDSGTRGQQQAL
jgi:hypothetical protein